MDWLRRWLTKEPARRPAVRDETVRERELLRVRQDETAMVVNTLRAQLAAAREAAERHHD